MSLITKLGLTAKLRAALLSDSPERTACTNHHVNPANRV
jgi:hypothetical protein